MSQPIITELPHSQVKLEFVVTPEEAKPYLDQAATDLQTEKPIQGFRPGKATYDDVKRVYGEMKIWEVALEKIVRARFVHAVLEQHLETVGSPAISVEQLVPASDLKFTTIVTIMPSVLTLCSYDAPMVTRAVRATTEEDLNKVVEDLRKMRRQEVVVDHAATAEDLIVVDLKMEKEHVAIEGGNAAKYKVYLNEPHYIPGFAEQVVGLKKGDTKTFTLPFPSEHYQKHLAGQDIDFTVMVADVYALTLPTFDDEFAKTLGQESADALRQLLKDNLQKEADQKADEAAEIELLEKMLKSSKFSEVPELLVNEEVRRMFYELQHAAEEQGMKMEDYLKQLKKTADEIKLDLVPRAIERVQMAVLIKELAKREKVEIPDADVDAEIDRILAGVSDKETRERVSSPEYRDYVATQMRNRKTMEILKQKGIANA